MPDTDECLEYLHQRMTEIRAELDLEEFVRPELRGRVARYRAIGDTAERFTRPDLAAAVVQLHR